MFYTKYLQHLRFTKILLKEKNIHVYTFIYYFYEKEIKAHRQTLQEIFDKCNQVCFFFSIQYAIEMCIVNKLFFKFIYIIYIYNLYK